MEEKGGGQSIYRTPLAPMHISAFHLYTPSPSTPVLRDPNKHSAYLDI